MRTTITASYPSRHQMINNRTIPTGDAAFRPSWDFLHCSKVHAAIEVEQLVDLRWQNLRWLQKLAKPHTSPWANAHELESICCIILQKIVNPRPMPALVMARDKDHRRFNLASSRLSASSADSSQFYLKSCLRMSLKCEDLVAVELQKSLSLCKGPLSFKVYLQYLCSPGSLDER